MHERVSLPVAIAVLTVGCIDPGGMMVSEPGQAEPTADIVIVDHLTRISHTVTGEGL